MVIHAGHAPVAAAYTGPDSFAPLLARHPRLTAIIAHMGAPDYADFVRLASQRPHHEGLPFVLLDGRQWVVALPGDPPEAAPILPGI